MITGVQITISQDFYGSAEDIVNLKPYIGIDRQPKFDYGIGIEVTK